MSDEYEVKAQLRGVELALDELKTEYKRGTIEIGRYLQLKREYESEKAQLELELGRLAALATSPEDKPDTPNATETLPPPATPIEENVISNDTTTWPSPIIESSVQKQPGSLGDRFKRWIPIVITVGLAAVLIIVAYPQFKDDDDSLTPTPSSTSTLTITPLIAPTATTTPSPTVTHTPTATHTLTSTPTPSPTPTLTPTSTPNPTSTPTSTPRPTSTPTPEPPLISPIPLRPAPELEPVDVNDCNVTFKWSWSGNLDRDKNEYFEIRVLRTGNGEHIHRDWTDGKTYTYRLNQPPGNYKWEVAVCRVNPETSTCEELVVSEFKEGISIFQLDRADCASVPPAIPGPSPTPTRAP